MKSFPASTENSEDFHAIFQRSQTLLALAKERTAALVHQMAIARQELAASKELLKRATTVFPSYFQGLTATVLESPPSEPPMPHPAVPDGTRTFAAVTELIKQVERVTHEKPAAIDRLIADINSAIETDETDPCALIGFFMEGILQVLTRQVPAHARRATVLALVTVLFDRAVEGNDKLD